MCAIMLDVQSLMQDSSIFQGTLTDHTRLVTRIRAEWGNDDSARRFGLLFFKSWIIYKWKISDYFKHFCFGHIYHYNQVSWPADWAIVSIYRTDFFFFVHFIFPLWNSLSCHILKFNLIFLSIPLPPFLSIFYVITAFSRSTLLIRH